MFKKLILLVSIVLILISLTGCKLLDGLKKDIEEAKEDLDKPGQMLKELQNRDKCLDVALTDGTTSDACPGAGD